MLFQCFSLLLVLKESIAFSAVEKNTIDGKAPTLEVDTKDIGTHLVKLDEKILRMLILPEPGRGDELLQDLESFFKNFKRLDGLVVLHEQSAFRTAKYVVEQECPKFVTEAFDVITLKDTYNWDATQFAQFREYLLLIAGIASKFPDDFSRMRVDVETLFERPLAQD